MKTKERTETLDCPLCGKKGVIFKTPLKQKTIPGRTTNIGDYSMQFTGGEYDVHNHAKECAAMQYIRDKEHYLMIFLYEGNPPIQNSDFNQYETYAMALEKVGLKIHNQNVRIEKQFKNMNLFSNNNEWRVEMYLASINETDICEYVSHIIAETPDAAFAKLKDRLLCGETVKIIYLSGKEALFQLHTDGRENLTMVSI